MKRLTTTSLFLLASSIMMGFGIGVANMASANAMADCAYSYADQTPSTNGIFYMCDENKDPYFGDSSTKGLYG